MHEKIFKNSSMLGRLMEIKGLTISDFCHIHKVKNQIYSKANWAKVLNAELNSQQKIHVYSNYNGKIQCPDRFDTEKQILME